MPAAPVADASGAALARLYDLDVEDDQGDLDMYLAMAGTVDGPVLELMAGSGRVAVPLALAGQRVTAVDRDAAMLERAAARWQRVKRRAAKGGSLVLVERDVSALELKKRFGLVIVALNSLLLLDGRDAQRAALEVAARHLARTGRVVIDAWLPAPEDLVLYDGRLVLDWVRQDTETGRTVSKTTAARYDSASRTAQVTSFFDAWRDDEAPTRTARHDTISFVAADELRDFGRQSGLIVDTIAGDYEMGHFAAGSERVVMVFKNGRR